VVSQIRRSGWKTRDSENRVDLDAAKHRSPDTAFAEMKKSGNFEIRSFSHRQMGVNRKLSYDERAWKSASGNKQL
jgi:hypothetical protein